jgi:hypothetical protein
VWTVHRHTQNMQQLQQHRTSFLWFHLRYASATLWRMLCFLADACTCISDTTSAAQVESGVQINLNVNKEKPEGGVNINLNVNSKDISSQQGGQSLRESPTQQGDQIVRESHTQEGDQTVREIHTQQGGQSLSEGDMMRGEKLLAQLQNSASQKQAHAAGHTRVAQQKHDMHKKARAGPMLHFTSKMVPADGKDASKKVETFNFKV